MKKRLWLLAGLMLLSACAELPYYSQSLRGQLEVMRKARPIEEWLAEYAEIALVILLITNI